MANHLSFDVLSRLVERRASPVEEAKAQRHLASCGRCRSELAWLERIHGLPGRGAVDDDLQMRRFEEWPRPGGSGEVRRGQARTIAADWLPSLRARPY